VQLNCEVKLGQPTQPLYIHQLATKAGGGDLENHIILAPTVRMREKETIEEEIILQEEEIDQETD
jgi:hypothetical protein